MSRLTSKQLKFCRLVVDGKSDVDAYLTAYKCTQSSAEKNAFRLRENEGVKEKVKSLQDKTETKETLSRQRKREILSEIAEEANDNVRVQAIKTDNEMTGDNAPIRVEEEITVKGIWDRLEDTTGLPVRGDE